MKTTHRLKITKKPVESMRAWKRSRFSNRRSALLNTTLQACPVAAAARQFFPVLQDHDVLSAVDRYQFLDLADICDRRTMDADEMVRVKTLGNAADRFPQKVGFLPHVQAHVVGRSFHPIDTVQIQEHNSSVDLDHQTIVTLRCGGIHRPNLR